jgi:hypothetical protein
VSRSSAEIAARCEEMRRRGPLPKVPKTTIRYSTGKNKGQYDRGRCGLFIQAQRREIGRRVLEFERMPPFERELMRLEWSNRRTGGPSPLNSSHWYRALDLLCEVGVLA